MIGRAFAQLVFRLVRLFYARIEVHGHWPEQTPTIFVLNHPNGILDPALVMAARLEAVTFLAKSTLFSMPAVAWAARQFGALPIYRTSDLGKRGAALDATDMAAKNENTFAECRRRIHKGRAMALFPEGRTHDAPQLLPIRSGVARIGLTAARDAEWRSSILIVPVGLWYEDMTRFRTQAILNVGREIQVDKWKRAYQEDARLAVQQLTAEVERRLEETMLQAESHRRLRVVSSLALWTVQRVQENRAGSRLDWSARILRIFSYLQVHDPDQLQHIRALSASFQELLRTAGINHPRDLENTLKGRRSLIVDVLGLAALGVPAVVGLLLSILPWGVIRALPRRLNRTQAGTIKLLGGLLLSALSIAICTVAAALILGFWWGLGMMVIAPVCMYAVLRWHELYQSTKTAMTVYRLRRRRTPLVSHLAQSRTALTEAVREALEHAGELD